MKEKWVKINLGKDIECRVRIDCSPNTPDDILKRLALTMIQNALPLKKKNPMEMYADTMQRIDDYNYLQGKGLRWEAEKRWKEMMARIRT